MVFDVLYNLSNVIVIFYVFVGKELIFEDFGCVLTVSELCNMAGPNDLAKSII